MKFHEGPGRSIHYGSPSKIYEALDAEFHFTLDPCPLHGRDGLKRSWKGERIYCNPPYGTGKVEPWLIKAREAEISVFLLPVRTDTQWFHRLVLPFTQEIRLIEGRIAFPPQTTGAKFPSMIVIFR